MFIKAPEVLFEFPLLAIGLDWLELAIILKSKKELSQEAYLKTHNMLKKVFFTIDIIVLAAVCIDIGCAISSDQDMIKSIKFKDKYNTTIDCLLSLITASFSTIVLMLFIGAYISLVYSIGHLKQAIEEFSNSIQPE